MGTVVVVPGRVAAQLVSHRGESERDENPSSALGLHRANKPFDDRDTAVLADRAEPGSDGILAGPVIEGLAEELLALVGDDVLGARTRAFDDAVEELAGLSCGRHLLE